MKPLLYRDLLISDQTRQLYKDTGGFSTLASYFLGPRYIPVHPKVIAYDRAFSQPFIDSVRDYIPASMQEDLNAFRDRFKFSLDVLITEQGMRYSHQHILFDSIGWHAKDGNSIDVAYGSSNIALVKTGRLSVPNPTLSLDVSNAIPSDVLREYELERDGIKGHHTWYQHNALDNGIGLFLYFRNFAVTFNNMALEQIKKN